MRPMTTFLSTMSYSVYNTIFLEVSIIRTYRYMSSTTITFTIHWLHDITLNFENINHAYLSLGNHILDHWDLDYGDLQYKNNVSNLYVHLITVILWIAEFDAVNRSYLFGVPFQKCRETFLHCSETFVHCSEHFA